MKKKDRRILIGIALVAAGIAIFRRPTQAAPVKPTAGGGTLPRSPKAGTLPMEPIKNNAIAGTQFHFAL